MLVNPNPIIIAQSYFVETRAKALTLSIPAVVTTIQTGGYASSNDKGGATYKRVVSEPSHAGKFQSADGAWFELFEAIPSSAMFGAYGGAAGLDARLADFFAYITVKLGGSYIITAGTYALTSQPLLDISFPGSLILNGTGAVFQTAGAISAFKVQGSYPPYTRVFIGLVVDHANNATATAGIEQVHTSYVSWDSCTVIVGNNGASYKPHFMRQSDPANTDTGCFWTTWPRTTFRLLSGGMTRPLYGVYAQGSINANDLGGASFAGVVSGVYHTNDCGNGVTKSSSNGWNLTRAFYEFVDIGATFAGSAGARCTESIMCGLNRYEDGDFVLSITGYTDSAYKIPIMFWCEIGPDVTGFANNPNNLDICYQLTGVIGNQPNISKNSAGHVFKNADSAYDTITCDSPNSGSGFAWKLNGTLIAYARYIASGIFQIAGKLSNGVSLTFGDVMGISKSTDVAQNISGVSAASFSNVATVTFGVSEVNANYRVVITPRAGCTTFYVDTKSVSGFTIGGSGITDGTVFDYIMIKD